MIKCENLSFNYQQEVIFFNVSFMIEKGEYVLIIGGNGSGKSTLLKCLLGIKKLSTGMISIDNIPLQKFVQWHKIGYVAQRAAHLTMTMPVSVKEVVMMGQVQKLSDRLIDEQLELVDMLAYKNESIHNLSGGQQQRVLIARAMLSNPEYLFLDEPTVGLDAQSVRNFYRLIGKLHKLGHTIIMVTHDVHTLTEDATRIIEMNRGIIFDGPRTSYAYQHKHNCALCAEMTEVT